MKTLILALSLALIGTSAYAAGIDYERMERVDKAIREAAGRALRSAPQNLQRDIRPIQLQSSPPRPAHALIAMENPIAAAAIVREMAWPDLMEWLDDNLEWIEGYAVGNREIDSNFSKGIWVKFENFGTIYRLLIDTASAREWLEVATRANRTLAMMRFLSRRPVTKFIPYRGEPDATGSALTVAGAATANPALMLTGAFMSGWNTPVHELVPDEEMATLIRETYERVEKDIRGRLKIMASALGVSAATQALASANRPVSFVTYGVERRFRRLCEKLIYGMY